MPWWSSSSVTWAWSGGQKAEWFEPARIVAAFRDSSRLHQYKVLDTSVIIDGRIADICETGFLEGTLVAPQFVLRELQQVADSSDSLKRNRGRRGLDILQKMQKMAGVTVQIVETDFPEIREVDLKSRAARKLGGRSSPTTSTSTRSRSSVACPSSTSTSSRTPQARGPARRAMKSGHQGRQGAGAGRRLPRRRHHGRGGPGQEGAGRTIEVSVTSVLQTTAGKMIFTPAGSGGLPRRAEARQPPGRPARPRPQRPRPPGAGEAGDRASRRRAAGRARAHPSLRDAGQPGQRARAHRRSHARASPARDRRGSGRPSARPPGPSRGQGRVGRACPEPYSPCP